MSPLLLPSSEHADYYFLFYVLGFGVAGALLLQAAYAQRYPWRQWLPLLAGTLLSLILGTRLIAGTAQSWQHLFSHAEWTGPDTRSILGGILGAGLALAVLRRALGFGRDVYDVFALPLLVGLAVQGVGCLLTGCCFGTATAGHFGVCYAPGTLPFLAQAAQGVLPATAAHSLPVHPAQLYQIVLCLLISGFLSLPSRHRQAPGQQFLQAVLLYAAGRFGLEFLRDTSGDVLGSAYWHGLKQVQWMLLLVVAGLLALIMYRGRLHAEQQHVACKPASLWRAHVLLGVLLVVTALLGPNWLALPEQLIIKALLLASLGLEATTWLRQQLRHPSQLLGGPLLLGSLVMLLTSQTPAPDSRRYTTINAGGVAGTSEQYFGYPYGCSGTRAPVSTYQQQYAIGSIGVARTLPIMRSSTVTLGVDMSLGRSNFRSADDSVYFGSFTSNFNPKPFERGHAGLYSISPYVEVSNPKYLRVGLGAHIGNVAYDYIYRPGRVSRVRLQSVLEVGMFQVLYLHASINHGMMGLGNGYSTLGLGTGLGQERLRLVGGVALANSQSNAMLFDKTEPQALPFLQAQIPLGQNWTLEPFVSTSFNNVQAFRLRASFRLPAKPSSTTHE